MRIYEIASADDQIALFKLITDKVWQALGDQQRAEAETNAAQPLKAKLKPISPKKPKPPAARTVPKPTVRAAPSAKRKLQPERPQPFSRQSLNIQAQSTKQNPSINTATDSKTQSFSDFDNEKERDSREADRHS